MQNVNTSKPRDGESGRKSGGKAGKNTATVA